MLEGRAPDPVGMNCARAYTELGAVSGPATRARASPCGARQSGGEPPQSKEDRNVCRYLAELFQIKGGDYVLTVRSENFYICRAGGDIGGIPFHINQRAVHYRARGAWVE
jgi:hypothetical protein